MSRGDTRTVSQGSRRRMVAIVDDDPASRRALAAALLSHFDVYVADDAQALVNTIRAGRFYDAIVSDVFMPYNGCTLYEAIEKLSARQAQRMIFVSGGGLPNRLKQFMDARRYVMEKPIDVDELVRVIEEVAAL